MRRAAGAPNEFSRSIAAAIDTARRRGGVSTPVLIERSGLSPNYYYKRARGEAPFSTNDLQILADALGIPPRDLLSAALDTAEAGEDENRVDPDELAARVRKLVAVAAARTPGLDVEGDLLRSVPARTAGVARERWESLLAGDPVDLGDEQLAAVATYFGVHPEYLRATELSDVGEQVDARLDVDLALIQTGALGTAARSVSPMSADALRAIADAIRAAGPDGPPAGR